MSFLGSSRILWALFCLKIGILDNLSDYVLIFLPRQESKLFVLFTL